MCYRWKKKQRVKNRGAKREVAYTVHLSESTQLQDSSCISQEIDWSRGRPFISVDKWQRKIFITHVCTQVRSWWTWWEMGLFYYTGFRLLPRPPVDSYRYLSGRFSVVLRQRWPFIAPSSPHCDTSLQKTTKFTFSHIITHEMTS